MRLFFCIWLLLFFSEKFFSQEVFKDTLFEGKSFSVEILDDSAKVICIGNYYPYTYIRNGEWDYFYPNGKLYARTFFKKDIKEKTWIYFNREGYVSRECKASKLIQHPQPTLNGLTYAEFMEEKNPQKGEGLWHMYTFGTGHSSDGGNYSSPFTYYSLLPGIRNRAYAPVYGK